MKKQTVLLVYLGRKGGGNLDAYESALGFIQNNVDVIAILSSYIENLADWEKLPLKKLIKIDTYRNNKEFLIQSVKMYFGGMRKYRKQLASEEIDFIYTPMLSLWSFLFHKVKRNAKVLTVIHDPDAHSGEENRIFHYLYGRAIQSSDTLLVHSERFLSDVKQKYSKPCYYIPLGRHSFYRTKQNKITSISYDKTKYNFLFFGRISPYKGLDILAKAYKELRKERENISLSIVGNGDFSAYKDLYIPLKDVKILNRWIADEEVESIFTGENLICVLPYLDATQSGVALLAMDYGIPVIASDTGALAEQIVHDKTGLLVKAGNASALKSAMRKILDNTTLYQDISKNEKEYIKSLSWENSMRMVLSVVEEVYVKHTS